MEKQILRNSIECVGKWEWVLTEFDKENEKFDLGIRLELTDFTANLGDS